MNVHAPSVEVRNCRRPRRVAADDRRPARHANRGFTLIELLVVIGVIAVLIGITVIAVGGIARDTQLTAGVNRVKAALGSARALAIERNEPIGVVFRVHWDLNRPAVRQATEVVTVRWGGEALVVDRDNDGRPDVINRFVRVSGVESMRLPTGIKVAAPWYEFQGSGGDRDDWWVTQPQFPNTDPDDSNPEFAGRMIGVLFDRDGSVITAIPQSDASERFLDLDELRDGNGFPIQVSGNSPGSGHEPYFLYDEPEDEPYILWASMLAVYDDDEAREFYGDDDWIDDGRNQQRTLRYFIELANAIRDRSLNPELGYIAEFADRIHFNRYTGVAMK